MGDKIFNFVLFGGATIFIAIIIISTILTIRRGIDNQANECRLYTMAWRLDNDEAKPYHLEAIKKYCK